MDFLLIGLILWGLYTIYKSISIGNYYYLIYVVIAYFIVQLFISGPKWRIFLTITLANLCSISLLLMNTFSIISKLNIPKNI
jgi:hypothetical protein